MIGLDTTAIIDFFKKDKALKKVIDKSDEPFASTIINYQEIMFGINKDNPVHFGEEDFYDRFFNSVFFLNLDKASVKLASVISWKQKKKGEKSGNFDCMIAGILLSNNVDKIITKNVKHFENIKGLRVISY